MTQKRISVNENRVGKSQTEATPPKYKDNPIQTQNLRLSLSCIHRKTFV